MRAVADRGSTLNEQVVTELHRRIVARSRPEIAGLYSRHPRRIAGSAAVFPNPLKIPDLMAAFGLWLESAPAIPEVAFEAHVRVTAIQPFSDGNGRTARLLMNLILLRGECPPVAIRPEDRPDYLAALEAASVREDLGPYGRLMAARLLATLEDYVAVLRETLPPA